MKISNLFKGAVLFLTLFTAQNFLAQTETKMVGGAEMYPTKNIVENAVNSKDYTTLVAAVKAADLVETLSSDGPFTVFVPTNATLVMPENKAKLQAILTYHVISGKFNAKDIMALIKKGDGKAEIKTVNGGILTAWMKGKDLYIIDANGTKPKVTIADVNQSNGVIHVIDTVVLPKS